MVAFYCDIWICNEIDLVYMIDVYDQETFYDGIFWMIGHESFQTYMPSVTYE